MLWAPILGCSGATEPDPPGGRTDSAPVTDSVPTDTATDTATADSATDTDTPTDTGPVVWQSLPNDCTPPATTWTDPFQLTGDLLLTQEPGSSGWFVELLDVAVQPDLDRVLAVGQGGLVVYDISTLAEPSLVGHTGPDSSGSERFYNLLPAGEDHAWVTHRDKGLQLVALGEPDRPEAVAEYADSGFEGLAANGDWLYVADTSGTLEIIDVSTRDRPLAAGTVTGLGRPWDVLVHDGAGWVADGDRGVVALDLSDPSAPALAGEAESQGAPIRLATDGAGALYVASGAAGVEVYDVSFPLEPVFVRTVDVGGGAQDVAVEGGLLGVATQEAVVLLDLSDPLDPAPHAYQETEQFAMTLDAEDGIWAVGDWNILGLWSASDTAAPALDASVGTVAFLDGGETRELTLTNRGAADLTLTGLALPEGLSGQVTKTELAPGRTATLQLQWDGQGTLNDQTFCLASDDPGRPALTLDLTSGHGGEGKAVGQEAPDFTLDDLDGTTWKLSELRGHPVVLAYFATW